MWVYLEAVKKAERISQVTPSAHSQIKISHYEKNPQKKIFAWQVTMSSFLTKMML